MHSARILAVLPFVAALLCVRPAAAQGLPAVGGPAGKPPKQLREPQNAEEAVKISASIVGVAAPGATVRAVFAIDIHPGWHIYWENPGESGAPTDVALELPAGCSAPTLPNGRARIDFPAPSVFEKGETTFGYEKRVLLSVPITIGAEVPAGGLPVKARLSYLVCKELCLMGRGEFTLDLAKASADGAVAKELEKSLALLPAPISEAPKQHGLAASLRQVEDGSATLVVACQGAVRFIPFDTPGARLASGYSAAAKAGPLEAEIELSRESTLGGPLEVGGILMVGNDPRPYSFRLTVPSAPR
ncbi:MAG: protein-disulfide reductase DsbD domain-containing protein [Planctomycetota bacterium]